MSIKIDKEFERLIPPLSPEEFAQLEENCIRDGIRDPLVVWSTEEGDDILIDGHNRWKILQKHQSMTFNYKFMKFDSRDEVTAWILRNQLGRRNLPTYVKVQLALRLKPMIAEKAEKNLHLSDGKGCQKSDKVNQIDTKKELAKVAGVSHDTIHKVEFIEKHGTPEIKEKARSGEISTNEAYRATVTKDQKPKTPSEWKREKVETAKQEHEAFQDRKADASVMNVSDLRKDKENQKILAHDLLKRCRDMGRKIFELYVDMQEGEIDLSVMYDNISADEKLLLLKDFAVWRRVLSTIEQGVSQ